MNKNLEISALPGDGIGVEIYLEAKKILNWIDNKSKYSLNISEMSVGGDSIDKYDEPLTSETLQKLLVSDAILLGAVGGPKWEKLSFDKRPERGLLKIRKELDLFANFRPAIVFNSLVSASTLKPEIIRELDIMIIRELTGGIYFGEPRGFDKDRAWNTLTYNRSEVERIARVSFDLAQNRTGRLVSVHKSNVLESSQFWQDIVHEVHKDFKDIELSDMYVDNAAMQIIQNPKQFDVIVTQNLFGDILSDISAMITGSLGMLPSASIGEKHSLYEPVHGSAPDLAGRNLANPIAAILSIAMMLGITFKERKISSDIYKAVNETLEDGIGTIDIIKDEKRAISTTDFTDKIINKYRSIVEN